MLEDAGRNSRSPCGGRLSGLHGVCLLRPVDCTRDRSEIWIDVSQWIARLRNAVADSPIERRARPAVAHMCVSMAPP